MKRKISILLLIALGFVPIIPNFRASSTQARTIDRHGKQIPSIFSGVSPSARIALEYARRINERREILGSFRTTIYRRADRGQLKEVCGGPPPCRSHYQVQYTRSCGSSCGGGEENWCYADSINASYCDGYFIDMTGCASGCQEENACSHPTISCQ